ncbi:hypothetical protein Acor_54660 [Acrocarpospora corrugata]|uniref:Uncharacterized protein n=1 Tax=Acrocarpospora corrugata TaxID=35763 RepID=A0A5M3W569_9ACTN|nr:hypothetical protein [Acrocarpospora corrugata]GES03400.1 hypothetical protein Acor_54660 [Acrocarpospora corrugata]
MARAAVRHAIDKVGEAHGVPILGTVTLAVYDELSPEPPPTLKDRLSGAISSAADTVGGAVDAVAEKGPQILESAVIIGSVGAAVVSGLTNSGPRGPLPTAKKPPRGRRKA